jgi:predicted small secreted protein
MNRNNYKMKKTIMLLSLVATSVAGCATVTQGTKDVLVIQTKPEDAQVQLSSGQSCVSTPCAIEIPRKDAVKVQITKKGCKAREVNVLSKMSTSGGAALAGNVLVGGFIGLGVDAATGASKELTPNPVVVTLDC